VLKLAPVPQRAYAALAAVPAVAPSATSPGDQPTLAAPAETLQVPSIRSMPWFSEVSQGCIEMRIANDGAQHSEIRSLREQATVSPWRRTHEESLLKGAAPRLAGRLARTTAAA
jgi:hypothetical protein